MRMAEFVAGEGERTVTISISTALGSVAANVNRWREQAGLPKLAEAELRESLRKLDVGDLAADYVILLAPESSPKREAILGAILQAQGKQWFFKLNGDAELAKREQPRFEEFVRSIRFRGAEGNSDGQ
jgi:hypothetical protein